VIVEGRPPFAVTSLPEFVVTIWGSRIGALNMAIAILLGTKLLRYAAARH
jgi:Ca2+/Na+ antiporter